MTSNSSLIDELIQLKDELALQTHLMTMELKDEWQALESKVSKLESKFEQSLVSLAAQMGKAEETFFVGDEAEIKGLVEEFQDLKKRTKQD